MKCRVCDGDGILGLWVGVLSIGTYSRVEFRGLGEEATQFSILAKGVSP